MNELEEALSRLPHGSEFRFVDRLLELDPGKSGVGELKLRGDEAWLPGHFPGEPMIPGVLMIEAAAQLAGIVAQCDPELGALPRLRLAAVNRAKILGAIRPGETAVLRAQVEGRLEGLIQARATAELDGR
ncbi:MAG: 3-hydroxyacyl-ACP dehydratase FabZ family protein, partial [Limisphaerales bacterium]